MEDKTDSNELFSGMRMSFGDMLSLLTHDINNKLSRLMILGDQLSHTDSSKELEDKFSNTVQSIAQMMRAATSMYLDRDEPEQVTVSELIDVGMRSVKKRLDQKEIELTVDTGKCDAVGILCQSGRVQFAIARVFAFFAKCLPEGAKVTISASQTDGKTRIEFRADKPVDTSLLKKESVDIFIVEQSMRAEGGHFECAGEPTLHAVMEL